MADKSNDTNYIDFFNNGDGDAHSFVATTLFSAAFNKEFIVTSTNENKEYRQKGKVLNFFISFGGSAYTLSSSLKIPIEEAEFLIENFYKGFPGLKVMFDSARKFALNKGYIRTNDVTNRVRWMRGWSKYQQLSQKNKKDLTKEEFKEMSKISGKIMRRGQNTIIQGTAGDMSKTALILLREKLLNLNILPFSSAPIKIINIVHDKQLVVSK
jgi:DNA polymerase-1